MKTKLTLAMLIVALFAVHSEAQIAGSFQWMTTASTTTPCSTTYATETAIQFNTGSTLSYTPKCVTKQYVFVDLWCCPPMHYQDILTDETTAQAWAAYWQNNTYDKAGYVQLPNGKGLAWKTIR